MKRLGVGQKKLDDRSSPMIHLGSEPGTCSYRMFDPVKRKIIMSSDVKFIENQGYSMVKEKPEDVLQSPEWVEFIVETQNFNQDEQNIESGSSSEVGEIDYSDSSDSDDESQTSESGPSTQRNFESPNQPTSQPRRTGQRTILPKRYSDFIIEGVPSMQETTDEEIAESLSIEDKQVKFQEAIKDKQWVKAMEGELASIEKNQVWKLVDPPKGAKIIGVKWVYKVKRDSQERITRYKARLVAKGYLQKQGIDFDEVFALVARIETVRLLLALAASRG